MPTLNTYKAIINYLFDIYYANFQSHSEVTSSFWKITGNQRVECINGNLRLNGSGFGVFVPNTTLYHLKDFFKNFLSLPTGSNTLLKKYGCVDFLRIKGQLVAAKSERVFQFDCAKQVLSLQCILMKLLNGNIPASFPFRETGIKTVCVIGDGYGYMTSLLKLVSPALKVICVNLGRTLLFDTYYIQKVLADEQVGLIISEENKREIFAQNSILFMEAERYELLKGIPIDLFINIASMQEMDNLVIQNYFRYMRTSSSATKYFYCCNRVEKKLPDGEVTRFAEYPWGNNDHLILLDELCPWYQKYPYSTPPFWRPLDGPVQHRLVELR